MADNDRSEPDPSFGPKEVVELQVDALATNDDPYEDAGIETAFAFASPANKANTGPLNTFKQMVRNDRYKPMIDHSHAEYGLFERDGDVASQIVTLQTREGNRVAYEFRVSLQSGNEYEGCWMTDSVHRV